MAKKRQGNDFNAASNSKDQLDADEEAILEYLRRQNRPYSATDIFSNLHGAIGKTAVVRTLTSLSEGKSLIHCKTYGKQSVYVIRQDQVDAPSPDEIVAFDERLEQLKKRKAELTERITLLSSQLNQVTSYPETSKLQTMVPETEEQVRMKKSHLEQLEGGQQKVDPQERTNVMRDLTLFAKTLRERKRICLDMVNGIMEGAEGVGKKTAKEFMEEMGCEVN